MLTGILLFLLFVVLLLAVPLTLTFNLLWSQGLSGHVQIGWANGLVHTHIPIRPDRSDGNEKTQKRKNKETPTRSNNISAGKLLRNKPFRERIVGYIRHTWDSIEKINVRLFMRIGLGDPADTGLLWSVFGPLSAVLASNNNTQISLQPDFIDETFELESSGTIRIVPLRHIYLTTKLLVSPTVWSGIIRARSH